jgi:hypothetical protein
MASTPPFLRGLSAPLISSYSGYVAGKALEPSRNSLMEFLIVQVNGAPSAIREECKRVFGAEVYALAHSFRALADKTKGPFEVLVFEDLVADFVLLVLEGSKKLNFHSALGTSFEGYLFSVFANYIRDEYRKMNTAKRAMHHPEKRIGLSEVRLLNPNEELTLPGFEQLRDIIGTFHPKAGALLPVFDLLYGEGRPVKVTAALLNVHVSKVYRLNVEIEKFLRSKVIRDRITLLTKN